MKLPLRYTVVVTDADAKFMEECCAKQRMNRSQVVRLALEKLRADPIFSLTDVHTTGRSKDTSEAEQVPA